MTSASHGPAAPDHITVRDADGFPVDVIMLPGPGFYELFEPLPGYTVQGTEPERVYPAPGAEPPAVTEKLTF